jgi:hypothetical protein
MALISILALAFVIGVACSLLGGAIGGVVVGGKDLSNPLAATMGGFYGPMAGVAGVAGGLIVLVLTR